MSTFGDDLIRSLNEALAHARGDGPAIVHAPVIPREVRMKVNLTQAQMAPLMGHESFRLPEVGAGNSARQRPGRDAATGNREGAGGRQARPSVSVTDAARRIRYSLRSERLAGQFSTSRIHRDGSSDRLNGEF